LFPNIWNFLPFKRNYYQSLYCDSVLHSGLETILSLGSRKLTQVMHKISFLHQAEHRPSVTEQNSLMFIILRSTLNTIIYILWARWKFLKSFAEMVHIVTTVLQTVNETTRLMVVLVASCHFWSTTGCSPVPL